MNLITQSSLLTLPQQVKKQAAVRACFLFTQTLLVLYSIINQFFFCFKSHFLQKNIYTS